MKAIELIAAEEKALSSRFSLIDETSLFNQRKVLDAFREEMIALRHFAPSTGYGYGDEGRDTLGRVFARAFGAERAIASPVLLSGTHALTVALFGLLVPSDSVLCITGTPYDTLRGVVWGEGNGSLKDYKISFETVALTHEGKVDEEAVRAALSQKTYQMVYIQRSRGYELRDAFTVEEIGNMCSFVRAAGFEGVIFVDNCYGEFVETREPTEVGADVIVGSLIKNPGGGLAPTGGYIAGKEACIARIENRLTAPSVGGEVGSYAYGYQYYYQGLFLAPHTVAQALKGGSSSALASMLWATRTSRLPISCPPTSPAPSASTRKRSLRVSSSRCRSALPSTVSCISRRGTCPATTAKSSWRQAVSCRGRASSSPPMRPSASPTRRTSRAGSPTSTAASPASIS